MNTPSDDPQEIIRSALTALKRGDKDTARRLAEQANTLDPGSEKPWLIMAALADPQVSVAYIRRALLINPHSQQAQQALTWALTKEIAQPTPEAARRSVVQVPGGFTGGGPGSGERAALTNTQPVRVGPSLSPLKSKWRSFFDRRWLPYALAGLAVIVVIVILVVTRPQDGAPQCLEPRLVVGSASFRLQPADPEAAETLPAASQDPKVALWVNGTSPNFVMLLNPATQNQYALASLQPGAAISANWADCTQETYTMQALDVRPDFNLAQVDPSRGGITLVLLMDAAGRAMVVTSGALPTATP